MLLYATFEYYRDQFGGTELNEDNFDRYMRNASQRINYATFERAKSFWLTADEDRKELLSDCACAIADILYYSDSANALINPDTESTKKLEIVGRFHVTYANINTASEEGRRAINMLINETLRNYLTTTNLLSARVGVRCNGY